MKLIDLHNHVLPNIDDGSPSIEESIKMLKMAKLGHVEKIIVTPHFKEGVFENTKDIIQEKIDDFKQLPEYKEIGIELYPGCEIFLTKQTASLLNNNKIQTLNHSKYILVEIHRLTDFWLLNLKEELYNLSVDGYKIILAHPERYEITHKNPNFIYDLVQDGHYIQMNVNCLNASHPNHKIARKLLDHRLVHFISSDAHNLKHRPIKLAYGYEFIKKHYQEDYAYELFYQNPLCVINDEEIKISDFKEMKAKKFFFFKK